MTQPRRMPRLDDDQRCVLEYLAQRPAYPDDGAYVDVVTLQRATVWPIRPALDSLRRRQLVSFIGGQDLTTRSWRITDAGREALR